MGHGDFLDSALHICSQNHYLACAEALLEHGAKVDVLNKRGESPLYQASCLPNRIDIVELMLSYGANPRIHTNPPSCRMCGWRSEICNGANQKRAIVNTQNPATVKHHT